jgi:hypothetical protein
MAAKRNKFHLSAVRAAIHGSTEGWIATIDHLVHVFDYGSTWMEDINHFFVMVCKDFLKDIHMNIIEEMDGKKKPHPSRLRGRGVEVSKTLCSRRSAVRYLSPDGERHPAGGQRRQSGLCPVMTWAV